MTQHRDQQPRTGSGQWSTVPRRERVISLDPPQEQWVVAARRGGDDVFVSAMIGLDYRRRLELHVEPQPMSRRAADRVAQACEADEDLFDVRVEAWDG